MTTQLKPPQPDDLETLAAWYDLIVASDRHGIPTFPLASLPHHTRMFTHPWPGLDAEHALLWDDDELVGYLSCFLPMIENQTTFHIEIAIHPDHRRRGYGSRLLAEAYAIGRRRGRELMEFMVPVPIEGGGHVDGAVAAFAARLGEKPALRTVRRQWISGADADHAALAAEAWTHADGYELRQWRDHAPDNLVDGIAALETRLILDAPMGDLVVENEVYDADRIRQWEDARIGRGARLYTTVAIHTASGEVAATTLLTVDEDIDDHAWQQITIVDPTHRGHRLGLLVKVANQEQLMASEPGVRVIDTFNADSNEFMIAVNEKLGFRACEAWDCYQIAVPAAAD